MREATVQGTCHPDFDLVRQEFARNFAERGELGASLHITLDGEAVVDLWGGIADPASGRPWEADTLAVVYSCTKGIVALAAHILVDRGLLDLEAPVSDYWPEFGCAGKEHTTVRMLLDHSAGLPAVDGPVQPGDMYDADTMASHLARQRPWWEPGTRNGYHLVTFGWTVGEVVRRVSGLSIGQFIAKEIAEPLGADFYLGLPEELEDRVAPITVWTPGPDYIPTPYMLAMNSRPDSVQAMAMGNVLAAGVDANSRPFRAAELGGMGGVASARGLAALYTPLALGGGSLVSNDTVARMSQTAVATSEDALLLIPTRFGLGFMTSMDNRRRGPRAAGSSVILGPSAFGHVGMGGSLGMADAAERIGFAYVMNKHGEGMLLNDKGQSLVDATYRSLGCRTNDPGVWTR
ncbi:MAG TPA: serine hydrolase domain-containing protein [Mycobacteriales bacterium]|nr:serine hydrolase domain-containing protein [Mycobacteriales bacterium]